MPFLRPKFRCECRSVFQPIFSRAGPEQELVAKMNKHFCSTSAFIAFADFDQCYFVKSTAASIGMRTTPSVYIWDKSNKNAAYFKQIMCQPGATYVVCVSI